MKGKRFYMRKDMFLYWREIQDKKVHNKKSPVQKYIPYKKGVSPVWTIIMQSEKKSIDRIREGQIWEVCHIRSFSSKKLPYGIEIHRRN